MHERFKFSLWIESAFGEFTSNLDLSYGDLYKLMQLHFQVVSSGLLLDKQDIKKKMSGRKYQETKIVQMLMFLLLAVWANFWTGIVTVSSENLSLFPFTLGSHSG